MLYSVRAVRANLMNKNPDLEIIRNLGNVEEWIEFYLDDDHLEIKTVNGDGDTFIIILNPLEIGKLKDLLARIG